MTFLANYIFFCMTDDIYFVGPLHDASTNRQVGIVSYGGEDCTADFPSIDCRVTDNLDYIEKIIRQTNRPQTCQTKH